MVRVLVYSDGRIDLEAPIHLEEDQLEVLQRFLRRQGKKQFRRRDVAEPKKAGPGGNSGAEDWTVQQYVELFTPRSNRQVAANIGRSEMAVKMMRGYFVQRFWEWAAKKGYEGTPRAKMIAEFIEDEA